MPTHITPLLALLLAAGAHAHPLGDLAASMKPGEWKEFATQKLDRDLLYQDVNGHSANPHTDFSDYLAWDPAGQQLLFLGSGNFAAYKFMRYRASTNTWSGDSRIPACMKGSGCASHGFDNGTLDPQTSTFFFFVGGTLFSLALEDEVWASVSTPAYVPEGVGGAMEWFPPLKSLVFVQGGTVATYDPASKGGAAVSGTFKMGDYHNVAAFSAPLGMVFFGGGNGSPDFYGMDASRKVERLASAPGEMHVGLSTLTVDPVSGEPLFLSEAGTFHAYQPAGKTWKSLGKAPFAGHGLAAPLPDHGVVFFLAPEPSKAYLYRHSSGTSPTRPPAGSPGAAGLGAGSGPGTDALGRDPEERKMTTPRIRPRGGARP